MTIASKNVASKKAAIIKALLLAGLVAAIPPAVRAEGPADAKVHTFLTTVHVQCGAYYHVVAACMGNQRDEYVAMGDKLRQRAIDATTASGSSPEPISQMVTTAKETMAVKTGGDCAKAGVLHNTYGEFCKSLYQGLIDMSKYPGKIDMSK